MPNHGCLVVPSLTISLVQVFAELIGIAKPIPWAYGIIAVLIAITLPVTSTRGPPLLPGLIEASV